MNYIILSHWTKEGLALKVNSYIDKGYEPVGSVSVGMTDTYADSGLEIEYVQAIQLRTNHD